MRCIHCEEGWVVVIRFKKTGKHAYVCDFCQKLWFEDEEIALDSGHNLASYSRNDDYEYSLEISGEKDQDHTPIEFSHSK